MPREAIRPSATLGVLLRERRTELGLSLGEVADRTRRRGDGIPATTIARIERGEADPGVLRLISLLRFYDIPLQSALELVEVRDLSGIEPPEGDLAALFTQGLDAFKKGDMRRGLAFYDAILRQPLRTDEDRLIAQKARLSFSINAGNLGRNRLSLQLVEALLLEPPHPSILVNTLIHASNVWSRLGGWEMAHALIDRAEKLTAGPPHAENATQNRAWIHHQRATVHVETGRRDAARAEIQCALARYAEAGDDYGHLKARYFVVSHRLVEGGGDALLAEARAVIEAARAREQALTAAWAFINLGRIHLERDESRSAVEALNAGLALAVERAFPEVEFHCHFYLAKAFDAQGDAERAQVELESARYYVRYVDEPGPEKAEIESLARRRGRSTPRRGSRRLRPPH